MNNIHAGITVYADWYIPRILIQIKFELPRIVGGTYINATVVHF